MFDATKLLGGFIQGRQGGAFSGSGGGIGGMLQGALSQLAGGRAPGATGAGGSSGGSPGGLPGGLGGLLSQVMGGTGGVGSTGSGSGSGFMDQVGQLARRAMEAPGTELRNNNPAAVGGAGALAGALLGGGRGALGGGLLAVLGSMAYAAYHKAEVAPVAPGASPWGQAAGPALQAYANPAEVQRKASLVLRAMIQATKADGHLDDGERERLTRHMAEAGDDREAQAFLEQEMARPMDIPGLAAAVRSPEEGAEIYAASVMAITVDTQAERDYLARLAEALRLPDGVVADLKASVKQAA